MPQSVRRFARPRLRPGYTLFEVMLVMAILVAVAAVAAPIFRQSFEIEALRKAGDALRTAWAKARVQAMTSGQTHVFRFDYGSDKFVTAVWDAGEGQTETSATTVVQRPGQLPQGNVFYAAEKLADTRAAGAEAEGGQSAPQIFFFPDGTTSTAQVMIANNRGRFVKVSLRGLTGLPRVGEVVSEEELEESQ